MESENTQFSKTILIEEEKQSGGNRIPEFKTLQSVLAYVQTHRPTKQNRASTN